MNSEKKDSISEEKTEETSPENTPVQDVLKKAEDPEKAEEKSDECGENQETQDNGISENPDDLQTEEKSGRSSGFSLKKLADTLTAYLTENNPAGLIIGLFLIFSSITLIKGIRSDPKINPLDPWQDFCSFTDIGSTLRWMVIIFAVLFAVRKLLTKPKINWAAVDSSVLVTGTVMFGSAALWRNEKQSVMLPIAVISICSLIVLWFLRVDDMKFLKRMPRCVSWIITGILAAGVGTFVIVTTVSRHRIFSSSTYDLGLFTQMYHSIITDFTQVTTCEREEVISHFAVHFSPVYYLLAPVYYLWPSAETLLVAQAVIAVSGVIPVYLLCRKFNFSNVLSMLFSMVYIFSAAIITPCYYDFHENIFLPPFLMWLFYAIEKEKRVLMYIMVVLTLMIKEDAALYLLFIALYVIFSKKSIKHGSVMFVFTGVVFATVLKLMSTYGEGAMTSRTFGNVMADYDGGLGEVLKTALLNPVYFISQCFTEDKVKFLITIMLPLLFLPFVTHKVSRMFLVVPFVVLNLLSGYGYAHDVGFQYVLGPVTCLIYAALINLADFKPETVKRIVPIMAVASVLMFVAYDTTKIYYCEVYNNNKENYRRKVAYLDYIPDDAKVLCSTYILPHVANRDEVYMVDEYNYQNRDDNYDFIALENDFSSGWKAELTQKYIERGYTVYAEYESLIVIYKSPDYVIE